MNPFCIPFAITNMSGALLAMDLGFMGPNYAINTGVGVCWWGWGGGWRGVCVCGGGRVCVCVWRGVVGGDFGWVGVG